MIRTFANRETARLWNGEASRRLAGDIQDRALRKLRQLDAAVVLTDLSNPPSNRLKRLRGDRS